MYRFLKFAVLSVFVVGGPIGLWALVRLAFQAKPVVAGTFSPNPTELISTVLTGLTVSVALLALIIAALAIWGYHSIKDEAQAAATKEMRRYLNSKAGKDFLRSQVRQLTEDLAEQFMDAMSTVQSFDEPSSKQPILEENDPQNQQRVANPYPKGDQSSGSSSRKPDTSA